MIRVETHVKKFGKSYYVLIPKPFGEEAVKRKAYLVVDDNGKLRIEFE